MKIEFFKMQAQGNDYIYCDLLGGEGDCILRNATVISKDLSRRKFSVGSDGLVLITKDKDADCKIIIYNSDGSKGEICGNALRCVGYYLSKKLNKNFILINTDSGVKSASINEDEVSVNVGKPFINQKCRVNLFDKKYSKYIKRFEFCRFVNLGNPHLVLYLKEAKPLNNGLIEALLSKYNDFNVEIVDKKGKDYNVTVYERGSGETLCCGTGAAAVYSALREENLLLSDEVVLNFKGGRLLVKSDKKDITADVYIIGKVIFCYRGIIDDYGFIKR